LRSQWSLWLFVPKFTSKSAHLWRTYVGDLDCFCELRSNLEEENAETVETLRMSIYFDGLERLDEHKLNISENRMLFIDVVVPE